MAISVPDLDPAGYQFRSTLQSRRDALVLLACCHVIDGLNWVKGQQVARRSDREGDKLRLSRALADLERIGLVRSWNDSSPRSYRLEALADDG